MSYPDLGAVILDATFDDLCPLVRSRVHPILGDFSHGMVREFFDLNIAENMSRYPGPVIVIRRCFDEMMSINGVTATNRANFLLIKLLQNRYPNLVNDHTLPILQRWLGAESELERSVVTSSFSINPRVCSTKLQSYMAEYGPGYPWTIGESMTQVERTELLLHLAGQYMLNYESTHCVPLPREYFRVPSAGNFTHY